MAYVKNWQGENGAGALVYGVDTSGDVINIEADDFGNLCTISHEHYRIHNGNSYEAGFIWSEGTAIADNANADLVIQVNSAMHVIFDIAVGGDCEVRYYTNTVWSIPSPQDLVTAYNKNEYSANTTSNVIYANPTVSDVGTLKVPKFIPGGGIFGQGGTDGGFSREKIWAVGSPVDSRLIRVTNRSGAATQVSITLEWYEPS